MDKSVKSMMENTKKPVEISREHSLLLFIERVLDLTEREDVPVLEKARFFAISAENLDEFFMVRAAKLKKQNKTTLLASLYKRAGQLMKKQQDMLIKLKKSLSEKEIVLLSWEELTKGEKEFAKDYFHDLVFSSLYPGKNAPSFDFTKLKSRTLYAALEFEKEEDRSFFVLEVPAALTPFIRIEREHTQGYLSLETLVLHFAHRLFPERKLKDGCLFRVIRDAEIEVDDQKEDFPGEMENSLKKRRYGKIVRADIGTYKDKELYEYLKSEIGLREREIFSFPDFVDYSKFSFFYEDKRITDRKALLWSPLPIKKYVPKTSWFDLLKKEDRLLYFPYDCFDALLGIIKEAAEDEKVLAIKQTIYRVGKDSPLIDLLCKAAQNGKQVMVVMELRAKFDESQNIRTAKTLLDAGCKIVYGRTQKKVHSKLLLITRKEGEKIVRYAHIGTGNYNVHTSTGYTDAGLLTSKDGCTEQVSRLFRYLAGEKEMKRAEGSLLLVSPANIRDKLIEKIEVLSDSARKGGRARLVLKVNALTDDRVIHALYKAQSAGVKVDLIVRGICTLVPGVKGQSEHIRVISIVGRFLEHSRIWMFETDKNREFYIGSADLMPKNLDKRIETMVRIDGGNCKSRLYAILSAYLKDTVNASFMTKTLTYQKVKNPRAAYNVYEELEALPEPFLTSRQTKVPASAFFPSAFKGQGGGAETGLPLPGAPAGEREEPVREKTKKSGKIAVETKEQAKVSQGRIDSGPPLAHRAKEKEQRHSSYDISSEKSAAVSKKKIQSAPEENASAPIGGAKTPDPVKKGRKQTTSPLYKKPQRSPFPSFVFPVPEERDKGSAPDSNTPFDDSMIAFLAGGSYANAAGIPPVTDDKKKEQW